MRSDKKNLIVELSFEFALEIIKVAEDLRLKKQFVISNQLLRSGTSVGANIREAQNAESKADFIHKMKIAAKEMDESQYWLELCKHGKLIKVESALEARALDIVKILSKIIASSKRNN